MAFQSLKKITLTSITLLLIINVSVCAPVPVAWHLPSPHPPARPTPSPSPSTPPTPSPPPAKSVVLALQWPMGLCKTSTCEKGVKLPGDRFTLHGVWPVQADGSDISYCQGKEKFKYSTLKKLKPLITTVWPSFQTNEEAFWRHQWEKHGTCSELEFSDYFERSLNLSKKYTSQLYKALEKNDITPSSAISMMSAPLAQKYFNAIVKSLSLFPRIKCTTNFNAKVYLIEIHLCAEFNLNNVKNCSVEESPTSYIGCGKFARRKTNKALYYYDPKQTLSV